MVDRNAPGAVFVGNISYDTTQDQLRALMQEVGPIKAIKLVLNRETGQHRGYGFVEYHSAAVAKSAMQNLAGRDLMGRKVRVDSANQNTAKATKVGREQAASGRNGGGGGEFGGDFSSRAHQQRQQQQPHQVVAGPSQHEAVRNSLQQLTVYQIYDVLKQMKALCDQKPQAAEQILLARPPLAQALLQAQHMFGMVHETVEGLDLTSTDAANRSARRSPSASTQRAPLPPQSSLDRGGGSGGGNRRGQQQRQNNTTGPGVVPPGQPPLLSALPPSLPLPSHPMPAQPQHTMPPQSAPPAMATAPPGYRIIHGFDNPVPENLVQQAMVLTPDQISGLTPEQQQSIGMIRQAVMHQQYAPPAAPYGQYR